jgi:hypothetical protein
LAIDVRAILAIDEGAILAVDEGAILAMLFWLLTKEQFITTGT